MELAVATVMMDFLEILLKQMNLIMLANNATVIGMGHKISFAHMMAYAIVRPVLLGINAIYVCQAFFHSHIVIPVH